MERNCIEHFNFAVQILWLNSDRAYYSRDAKRAKKKCNSPKKSHANCTKQYIRAKKIKNSRFPKLGTVRGCKNVQTTKKERNTAPGGRGGDTP